ncbi:MAG: caspase family protein [Patescibacteria group bacterium]
MKNKILALVLIGFLGVYLVPTFLANANNSQGQDHRAYPEFKSLPATDVEIVKKATLPGKGKPAKPGKPPAEPSTYATGVLGQPLPEGGIRYAIVVGIANYPGTANDLKYPDEDANAIFDVLTTKYGFSSDNIRLLVDAGDGPTEAVPTNATAQKIQEAILEIKGLATTNDEVVFFYSGHGGKGIADDGDTEKKDESIIVHDGESALHFWDGQLATLFSGFSTSRIVFIFDSCVAGGMTDLAKTGRIINMATEESGRFESAYEFDSLGYGEFTYYFVVQGMNGLADTSITDGYITTEEAFDYAKANTVSDHPTISDKFTDDLLL